MTSTQINQSDKLHNCGFISCGIAEFDADNRFRVLNADDEYKAVFGKKGELLDICGEDVCFLRDKLSNEQNVVNTGAHIRYESKDGNIKYAYMIFLRREKNIVTAAVFDITEYDGYKEYRKILQNDKIILLEADINNDICKIVSDGGKTEVVIEEFSKNAAGSTFENAKDVQHILECENCEEPVVVKLKMPSDKSAEWYMMYKSIAKNDKGEPDRIIGVLCNIDEQKRTQQDLIAKIEIDPLTKVYNRETAKQRIEKYLCDNKEQQNYALFMLDLDNFKIINDTFGHLYGDAVLSMTAGCIKSSVDEDDIVGRFGGDEFFVFITNSDYDTVMEKARNINKTILSMRKNISDDNDISCSIGVAHGGEDDTYEKLFRMADIALYKSKNSGKNSITEYTQDMSNDARGSLDYEQIQDDENENKTKSHDLVHIAIEIAARSTSVQNAVHMIMRHIGLELDVDDVKIMRVNFEEDMISIEHHWNKVENVAERDNRTGYYIHDDIVNLRKKFEEKPLFVVGEETRIGFSEKFSNELKKLQQKSVVYSSNLTNEKSFFYLILSCFKNERVWDKKTMETVSEITKILLGYLIKNYKGKIITDNDPLVTEPHTKLLYYDKFFEQSELIRKLAAESGQKVAVIHTDFQHMNRFDRIYGIRAGEMILIEYAAAINRKNRELDKNVCIATHVYGTDRFISLVRYRGDIDEVVRRLKQFNAHFCKRQSDNFPGYELIIKSGVCRVQKLDMLWDKIDDAYRLKQVCGELTECECFLEEER